MKLVLLVVETGTSSFLIYSLEYANYLLLSRSYLMANFPMAFAIRFERPRVSFDNFFSIIKWNYIFLDIKNDLNYKIRNK